MDYSNGCGGQVFMPEGYLKGMFELTRQHGGLTISDEVQTGFGRVGEHFWAFEKHGIVPDILTVGKPFGNGFPLAAGRPRARCRTQACARPQPCPA